MLCISAAIAVMRCLSVRPSVTFVDHIKTNKHIFKIFSAFGSHTTLVFPYQTGLRYSDGNPPNGGVECRLCYRQKSRFWSNSWLSKIAGRAKCQKHLPTTKPSIWHSRPHTTGYRSIAGRANYEVTKTVTDDHAQMIAQSATHQQMFVCDGLQHGRICQREENRKEFTFCIEAIQTRSIARPLRQQIFLF